MRQSSFVTALIFAVVACAALQLSLGVRTDEAKYLLNIPYPHPPLIRTVLGWTDGWMGQEIIWRLVFSCLLCSAGVMYCWRRPWPALLLWGSLPAVWSQAGSIMMAPLLAVQALVLLGLLRCETRNLVAAEIGCLWLAILLTSYQGVLLMPLIFALIMRSKGNTALRWAILLLPIIVLSVYTTSHPLSAASFLLQTGKDADVALTDRALRTVHLWCLGMGFVGVPFVLWRMVETRAMPVLMTFVLLSAYVTLGSFDYYAVFFSPFVLWALSSRLRNQKFVGAVVFSNIVTAFFLVALPTPSPVREQVMELMHAAPDPITDIQLVEPFGHEWQYESSVPVGRRSDAALRAGTVVVCLRECAAPTGGTWKALDVTKVYGAWQRAAG